MDFSFNSVEIIPGLNSSAAFTTSTSEVFKEQEDTSPVVIDKQLNYMPWGAANDMPYRILDLIEADETLSTCQIFNAEVCYGSGLVYHRPSEQRHKKPGGGLPLGQRPALVLPRGLPGLQALRLLRLRHHPLLTQRHRNAFVKIPALKTVFRIRIKARPNAYCN